MINLQVLSSSGSERERKDALKVLHLLEDRRHWVLVCLLLSNVVVNESLRTYRSRPLRLDAHLASQRSFSTRLLAEG